MKHTTLVTKPVAKIAEVLKKTARVLDSTNSKNKIGVTLTYTTLVLNHRQYVLIEKAGIPVTVEYGRGERKRTISIPVFEDFSMCYDQFQGETHGY